MAKKKTSKTPSATAVDRAAHGSVSESTRQRFDGVDRLTVTIYAIMALYKHGHISEGQACKLMMCSDIVTFRMQREKMFREMCQVLDLPPTPIPLPQP